MSKAPAGTVDMFLSVTGASHGPIAGESKDTAHTDEIDVLGWSWGMNARVAAGGGTMATGRATVRELKVSKRVDSATTALMGALRNNENITEAILTVRKAGAVAVDYLVIKLEDARVVSLEVGVDPGGSIEPLENIGFTFNKVEVTYTPQGDDGEAAGGMVYADEFTAT